MCRRNWRLPCHTRRPLTMSEFGYALPFRASPQHDRNAARPGIRGARPLDARDGFDGFGSTRDPDRSDNVDRFELAGFSNVGSVEAYRGRPGEAQCPAGHRKELLLGGRRKCLIGGLDRPRPLPQELLGPIFGVRAGKYAQIGTQKGAGRSDTGTCACRSRRFILTSSPELPGSQRPTIYYKAALDEKMSLVTAVAQQPQDCRSAQPVTVLLQCCTAVDRAWP